MALEDQDIPDEVANNPALLELIQRIATGVAQGMAPKERRKISFGEYTAQRKRKVKLNRETWQCGVRCEPHMLTDDEVSLLNQIDRSGRYCDRLVEVLLANESGLEVIHIGWNCKTSDQRTELRGRTFTQILQEVVAAQEAEDKEEAEAPTPVKRRPFGAAKATREARERAGI